MRVAVGLALGVSAAFAVRRPVFCDAAYSQVQPTGYSRPQYQSTRIVDHKGVKRFGGVLDYHQLALGSFTGMVTGYFAGKLSRILVSMLVGSFVTLEYLQQVGYLDISPYANKVYAWGMQYMDTAVLVRDPSFKVSFLSAFLIAAASA